MSFLGPDGALEVGDREHSGQPGQRNGQEGHVEGEVELCVRAVEVTSEVGRPPGTETDDRYGGEERWNRNRKLKNKMAPKCAVHDGSWRSFHYKYAVHDVCSAKV